MLKNGLIFFISANKQGPLFKCLQVMFEFSTWQRTEMLGSILKHFQQTKNNRSLINIAILSIQSEICSVY